MSDALENLKKLPPECAATIAGHKVWIVRGAKEPKPLSTPMSIAERNRQLGVTDAQVQAMIVGVTLGWDQPGADPDTHARVMGKDDEIGPFTYDFVATLELPVRVSARSGMEADDLAHEHVNRVIVEMLEHGITPQVGVEDTFDLIDTTDPRA